MTSRTLGGFRKALALFVGLALLLTAGCAAAKPGQPAPTVPAAESDWRNHLSFPAERVIRNWVLADNTMLAELEYIPEGLNVAHTYTYQYEVYDPKAGTSTIVVPAKHRSIVRKISDRSVEFVCDDFVGLQYLMTYDIPTRKVNTTFPAYAVEVARQFGLTNAYTRLKSVQTDAAGLKLSLQYAGLVPFMRIAGDKQSGTLVIQLPGLAAPDSALGDTSHASGLVESVSVVAGMDSRYGGQTEGTTIRIKTRATDWDKLTYSIVATRPGSADEFAIQVSETGNPIDLGLLLDPPAGWSNWRLRVEQGSYPIESTIELPDGTVLAKLKGAQTWVLCDPKSCFYGSILVEGDWPVLSRVTDREVQFLCQAMTQSAFPYLMVYDIETRSVESRRVNAALTAPVEFGSPYSFVFASCTPGAEGIALGVREGPVMAGGGEPPATRTWADEASHSFYVEFPGTAADGLSFGPIDPNGTPFIESISLVDGVRGTDGKTAPGATLHLVLDPDKWTSLTYNIGYHVDEQGNPGPGLVLTFSDSQPATDLTALQSVPR